MSHGIHFISNTIPGYGRPEGRCLLCSRTSGVAAVSSYPSHVECNSNSPINVTLMKRPVYDARRTSLVCSANPNNNRRNPDFSRQNRPNHSFIRNKNRPIMDRDKSENIEDSEFLSSRNGPLVSLSNSPRNQGTPTPGPREKEIVELFRKVQAQLRARQAMKEEKKTDTAKGQGKETETVDSLLKLLRKHSVDQGKKRNGSSSEDFLLDQSEQNNSFSEEHTPNSFGSNTVAKEESQPPNLTPFRRPTSNFRRRSPVPRVKYQPVYSDEENAISNASLNSQGRRKKIIDEPELMPQAEDEHEHEPELDHQHDTEFDLEPYIVSSDVHEDDEFDVMSDSDSESDTEAGLESDTEAGLESEAGLSNTVEAYNDNIVEIPMSNQNTDLSGLKLSELRVLAKSRGLKGSYKMKKADLVALLSSDSG